PTARVAVFVDGCFWHGCPSCYRAPKTHKKYWQMKVKRNQERDAQIAADCEASGWRIVRVWEHEVRKNAERIAAKIAGAVEGRGLKMAPKKPKSRSGRSK